MHARIRISRVSCHAGWGCLSIGKSDLTLTHFTRGGLTSVPYRAVSTTPITLGFIQFLVDRHAAICGRVELRAREPPSGLTSLPGNGLPTIALHNPLAELMEDDRFVFQRSGISEFRKYCGFSRNNLTLFFSSAAWIFHEVRGWLKFRWAIETRKKLTFNEAVMIKLSREKEINLWKSLWISQI